MKWNHQLAVPQDRPICSSEQFSRSQQWLIIRSKKQVYQRKNEPVSLVISHRGWKVEAQLPWTLASSVLTGLRSMNLSVTAAIGSAIVRLMGHSEETDTKEPEEATPTVKTLKFCCRVGSCAHEVDWEHHPGGAHTSTNQYGAWWS